MTRLSYARFAVAGALGTTLIALTGLVTSGAQRALTDGVTGNALGIGGALTLGALAALVAVWPHKPAMRRIAVVGAAVIVVVNLLPLIASLVAPAMAAMIDDNRPLRGVVMDLAGICLALAASRRARSASNVVALILFAIGATVALGSVYGGPLVMDLEASRFSPGHGFMVISFAIAIFAINGPGAWPTRLYVGSSVPAMLRRAFLPTIALCVVATDIITVRVFSDFSPAIGSTLNTLITLLLAGAVIAYVGRTIGRRLERSYRALQESEEKFSRVFQTVPVGMTISDLETGRLLDVNNEYSRIYGYSRDEVLGRTTRELGMWVDPADRDAFIGAVTTSGPRRDVDMQLRTKRGEERRIRAAGVAATIDETPLLFMTFVDETERLLLEERLRHAHKMEALGRLAGGVAHDFNNLLTVIIGWGNMLLERMEPSRPEVVEISEMVRAAGRAAELTRQLLAFSRQQMIQTRELDVNLIVENIERMLRRLIGEDVLLETHLARESTAVRGDAGQIEQVLANLVVNARDAMPMGGRLYISTHVVEVTESRAAVHADARPGLHVCLRVADTGVGMPPEIVAKIFEPFFTTKETGKGTGLGLATVFGIVKQHGGFITVESTTGYGTAFEVFLPRADRTEPAAVTGDAVPVPLGGSQTILVVEDNASVRAITSRILRSYGYDVIVAGGGEEALELVRVHAGPLDVLITDVVMPEMSGPALVDGLLRVRPGLKVLYVSGYADEALNRHGVNRQDVELLQKPFTPTQLGERLQTILRN